MSSVSRTRHAPARPIGAISEGLLLAGIGALLLALLAVVIGMTVLFLHAAGGPVTGPLTRRIWRWLSRARLWLSSPVLLQASGPLVTLVMLLTWSLMLWLGWSLVFMGEDMAVLRLGTDEPADLWERTFFAGTCITTPGVGDYLAGTDWARLATVMAAAYGFSVISLAITLLLTLLGAVVEKRVLAARVFSLGATAQEMLRNTWDGHRLPGLAAALDGLAQRLIRVGHQHHAFPILNAFHTGDRQTSLAVAVVVLDGLVTLLSDGVAVEARMPVQSMNAVRIGIHSIVSAAPGGPDGRAHSAAPPAPGRETLLDVDLPVVDETGYRARLATRAAHRARLRAFLEGQGWAWSAVHQPR